MRSAELHCQYRARFLSSLFLHASLSLSLLFPPFSSFFLGSLALFIFLSPALCGMKLSLLVAGATRCIGVPRALRVARVRTRVYTHIGDECGACLSFGFCLSPSPATARSQPCVRSGDGENAAYPSVRPVEIRSVCWPRDIWTDSVRLRSYLYVGPRAPSCRTSRSLVRPSASLIPSLLLPSALFLRVHHGANQKCLSISLG